MTCFADDGEQQLGVWVVNVEGTKIRQAVKSDLIDGSPTWGDDGQLYFINEGLGETLNRIHSAPAKGGTDRPATDGDGARAEASPDSGKSGLLYMSRTGEQQDIFLYRDGRPLQLTNTGTVSFPTWSPDETAVTWLAPSRTDPEAARVWVAKFINEGPGAPRLGRHRELGLSGVPGPPGWGSR